MWLVRWIRSKSARPRATALTGAQHAFRNSWPDLPIGYTAELASRWNAVRAILRGEDPIRSAHEYQSVTEFADRLASSWLTSSLPELAAEDRFESAPKFFGAVVRALGPDVEPAREEFIRAVHRHDSASS